MRIEQLRVLMSISSKSGMLFYNSKCLLLIKTPARAGKTEGSTWAIFHKIKEISVILVVKYVVMVE